MKEGLLYVKDLGSSNGTYVNGQRIQEARVKRGDDLRFDTLSFGVIGPSDDLDKTTVRTVPKGMPKTAPAKSRTAQGRPAARAATKGQPQRKPDAGQTASPPGSSQVETIEPTQSSRGRGGLIGVGLLIIIAGGVFFAMRNGWL